MTQELISVIIPVYNARPYLARCLDSLLTQDYPHKEIILVNDGSTDGSDSLCDVYAARASEIRVLHQPNRGPSAARNAGLAVMQGTWVAFVDSDDEVHPNYLSLLYRHSREADIIQAVSRHMPEGFPPIHDTYRQRQFTPKEALESLLYQQCIDASVHGKLIRSELFRDNRFDPRYQVYEDLDLISRLIPLTRNIRWIDLPLYSYLKKNEGQLCSVSIRRTDAFDVCEEIISRLHRDFPAQVPAGEDRLLSVSFNILRLLSKGVQPKQHPLATTSFRHITALRSRCLSNPHVRLKNKIGALLSYGGLSFLLFCFRAFDGKA